LILLNSTVHLKPKPTGSSPSPRFSASRNGCILAIPTEGETGDEDGKPIDFWVKSQKNTMKAIERSKFPAVILETKLTAITAITRASGICGTPLPPSRPHQRLIGDFPNCF